MTSPTAHARMYVVLEYSPDIDWPRVMTEPRADRLYAEDDRDRLVDNAAVGFRYEIAALIRLPETVRVST